MSTRATGEGSRPGLDEVALTRSPGFWVIVKFTVLRPVIGGIAFGLVGVALPLTLFTGTDQLTTVIDDGVALGAGLLIVLGHKQEELK